MTTSRRHALLPGLIFSLLLFGVGLPVSLTGAESAAAEQELGQLNQAIERIELWLEEAHRDRPAAEVRLQETEQQVAAIGASIAETRQAIADSNRRLQELQQQQRSLDERKHSQTELLRKLVNAAYREGSHSTMKLLLNQEDPAVATRMLHYYRHINAERLERVRDYERTLAGLAATRRELEAANEDLQSQQRRLDEQLQQLEQQRQSRQQALAELDQAINQRSSELEKLLSDREALEALIAEVQQAMETIPVPGGDQPFARRRGQLPWPGSGPLLTRFGEAYGNGDLRRRGITIGSEAGSPVRAVHSGRVVFADWLRGSGLLLIIDHGDGYMSLYGHNQSLAREQGDAVEAGSVVARAGNSGGQRETGLYFEIRYNGEPQDPGEWLKRAD